MAYQYLSDYNLSQFIRHALNEDIGEGDHSTLASVPADAIQSARLMIKGKGILAGVEMAKKILREVSPDFEVEILKNDGEQVKYGDIGMMIKGKAQKILHAERLLLNCMQRMSGIATATHELTQLIAHTKTKLLDTRKTTPNFRLAEKWAVAIGGGTNHRFGLFDMIMLKDNHVDYAGGITQALLKTKEYLALHKKTLRIEIETRNLKEVEEALSVGVAHVIMLDNMSVEDMTTAVKMINHACEVEASGGITKDTIVKIAETGVDFISVGALTHSFQSMDISLKAVKDLG